MLPGNTAQEQFQSYSFGPELAINDNDLVAFVADIAPGTLGSEALYALDIEGNLQLIAKGGDTIDVSNDPQNPDLRTIGDLFFTGNGAMNTHGQIVFSATISGTNGTEMGVFVSNEVAVPIPGDFTGDFVIDQNDLLQWEGDYGINGESDADGDGDSDAGDFLIWQRATSSTDVQPLVTPAVVPEPSALVCFSMASVALLIHRKR